MKIGGRIPWNVIPICKTFKISCLMGKLRTRDALENLLKDPTFRLVHWLSITLFLRRTSQESINLERKSYLDCSLDTLCTRGGIWKGDFLVADIEELETMDASEIYSKRLNAKEMIFPKENGKKSSCRWTSQTFWRRSGTENTHFDTGTPNSGRKSKGFSWRIRRVSTSTTSRLTSGCRWSTKWFFGPCQETSYTAITLNQESNFARREKNQSLFHWNTLTSPELHTQFWMSCKSAASMTTGISMDQQICLILGQVSLQTDICGPGWRLTKWQLTSRPDHLWPELWIKMGRNGKLREMQKWTIEKPKLDNPRKLRGIYFIGLEDKEFKETIKEC